MTKITPPPRRPLFAHRDVPVLLKAEEKAFDAARIKAKADAAEKPPKVKDVAKVTKRAADRAEKPSPIKGALKVMAKTVANRDITVAAIKAPGKPPQLETSGRGVQVNVKMGPTLMKGLEKRAKADKVKVVVVVRRAVEAYLS